MDNQNTTSSFTTEPAGETTQSSIFNDVLNTELYEKTLKNARIWLYVIAGIQFLVGIFEYFSTADKSIGTIAFGIDAMLAVIFLVLALWSREKPVLAFTSALVFYLLVHIGFMMLDPTNIFKGIIIKIFVVMALVKANRDARKYEGVKASLGESI